MEVAAGCQHITDLPSGALHQIFSFLGPKDLCQVGATCRDWRALTIDAATNQTWAAFYRGRWRLPQAAMLGPTRWQEVYGTKMRLAQAWHGRFKQDLLYGHRGGVRSTALLPSCQLLASGSMDRYLRLWDLQSGVPLTHRKLSGTVRAVAMDPMQLAAAASPQGVIRMWSADPATAGAALFDIEGSAGSHLVGHTGPVTCLELDDSFLASGSWDYTARIWSRASLRCRAVITFPDWLWDLRAAGGNLLVAAGACAHVVDLTTGDRLRMFPAAGSSAGGEAGTGTGTRIEGSRDGRLVFHGTVDGSINCYDLRAPASAGAAQLWHHSSPVTGLAYEDPCLAACFQDGSVLMLQAEALAAQQGLGAAVLTGRSQRAAGSKAGRAGKQPGCGRDARDTGLRRQLGALGCPAYSIAIADQWLACSGESQVVRTWDFTDALVKQEQAQRAKQARADHKQQKRLRAQAAALAALTSQDGVVPLDDDQPDVAVSAEHPSAIGIKETNSSAKPPVANAAGLAGMKSWHDTEQHLDGRQTGVAGNTVSTSHDGLSHDIHAASQAPAASPAIRPSASQQESADPSAGPSGNDREDQPGTAWAVSGSRAHEGSSHFQSWHAESQRGDAYPLSSSPHLAWGNDHVDLDPSGNDGGFEDELEDIGEDCNVDDHPTSHCWIQSTLYSESTCTPASRRCALTDRSFEAVSNAVMPSNSATVTGSSKGEQCKKEACNIQACLKSNNYDNDHCATELDQLKQCCEKAGDKPIHCAMFGSQSKPSGTGEKDSPGEATPHTIGGNYKR
ncbi:hypothetical protein WJX74_010356 [Apatococcus lobatus]|uniref:F-box domain-containing protein n=1 Tax=Apatococcus lobatus TaxID=904363 RepID=A0AAW1SFN2_9CHLO